MGAVPDRLAADNCPAARALDAVGQRWALLIVREALDGPRRFDEFRSALGISDHTLTRRLAELVERRILVREREGTSAVHRYRLTDAGRALAPVLAQLALWGDRWTDADPDLPGPRPRPGWMDVHPGR